MEREGLMVVFKGPVYRTGKKTGTGLDQTAGCGCVLFGIEITGPMNRSQPVLKKTGFSRDTP